MKKMILLVFLAFSFALFGQNEQRPDYVLVIHGGAGAISDQNMTAKAEKAYRDELQHALAIGDSILRNNGSSLDAVEQTIRFLEDCPLFNAGRGAVFTAEGKNELDASIMDGETLNAGAAANISTVKHPISLARKIMTHSKHVMLIKQGAEKFARKQGLEIVSPKYFRTQRRWESYQKAKKDKHGTVGVVALDQNGNLAAGTSTGGMQNKKYGRVGDSPIIGAGCYANNKTCAVSATGHGEFFIRNVVCYDISALIEYKNWSVQKAAGFVINTKLKKQNADGGVIALDTNGNIAMPFNTTGMFRGYIKAGEKGKVLIFSER